MQYLKKLKRLFVFNNLRGNLIFVGLSVVLLFIFFSSYNFIVLLFLVGLLIYVFIKHKTLFVLSIVVISIISSTYITKLVIYENAKLYIEKRLIVSTVKNKENYQYVILKDGIYKYIYYNKDEKFKVGDICYVKAKVEKKSNSRIPNGFDYNKYLKYQNIVGSLNIKYIKKTNNVFTLSKINYLLSEYYDKHFKNGMIIKALVIGVKDDLSEDFLDNVQIVGITHLFVVSGLHVGIITGFLEKILRKTKLKDRYKNIIIYVFLGAYLIITNFLTSVLRVTFGYILKTIFKKEITSVDLMVVNLVLMLLINPFYAFQYSFILTYLISSMIIIINPILSKKKSFFVYILNTLIISILSVIITLPIIVNINSNINLLSVIYNIFYIPFMSYVLLPVSIIISFIPFWENIVSFIYLIFIESINLLSKVDVFLFNMPSLSVVGIIIYYILIILCVYVIENRKWYLSFLLLIFFIGWYFKACLDPFEKIVFLDVSEGDATHIKTAFNKTNIIIDTGISNDDSIINYLKSQGIRAIDLLIISHGDDDHNGNLAKLLNDFDVGCVVLSAYDVNTFNILKRNEFKKYKLVKRGTHFEIDNISFDVLWPEYSMNDVNNNSLVFKMNYDGTIFLFTGDIEEKAEVELIKLEGKIDVDVLKIAHHASNTSTKKNWLDNVSFDVGVAMCGSKNTFGFPNVYTVERLKNYTVYYTSEHYTITFYKWFLKRKFKTLFEKDN